MCLFYKENSFNSFNISLVLIHNSMFHMIQVSTFQKLATTRSRSGPGEIIRLIIILSPLLSLSIVCLTIKVIHHIHVDVKSPVKGI